MKTKFKRIFFIFQVHKSIPFAIRFFTSKEISWKKRLLFAVLIIGYAVIPIDLIPEFILGFGLLDDVAVIAFLLDLMKKQLPEKQEEKSKRID